MLASYDTYPLVASWWIIGITAVAILLVAAYRWRRSWLQVGLIGTIIAAAAVTTLCMISWSTAYFVAISWNRPTGSAAVRIGSSHGGMEFYLQTDTARLAQGAPNHVSLQITPNFGSLCFYKGPLAAMGMEIDHQHGAIKAFSTIRDSYRLVLPLWMFAALTCPWFPLIWFSRHRRHRFRVKNNLCPACGFDLRAHAPGTKCPECGTLVHMPPTKPVTPPPTTPSIGAHPPTT